MYGQTFTRGSILSAMPEISRFFGITINMYYDDHDPPHIHVRYQDDKAKMDLHGNFLGGSLSSRTRVRLIRHWLEIHRKDLETNWRLAQLDLPLEKIPALK